MTNTSPIQTIRFIIIFLLGFVSFATAEQIWLLLGKYTSSNWVLEPLGGIFLSVLMVLGYSGFAGFIYSKSTGKLGVIVFTSGLMVTIPYYLLKIGPGNLWPFVIIIDYFLTIPFALLGWHLAEEYHFEKSKLHYLTGEDVKAGDKVIVFDDIKGIVAFCTQNRQYSPEFPWKEWGYLKEGLMVSTEEKGLIHIEDNLADVKFIQRKWHNHVIQRMA